MQDLRFREKVIHDFKKEIGVDISEVIYKGILPINEAKKHLVKELYFKKAKEGRTYADIKYELSVVYDISVSSIEKMIYRK